MNVLLAVLVVGVGSLAFRLVPLLTGREIPSSLPAPRAAGLSVIAGITVRSTLLHDDASIPLAPVVALLSVAIGLGLAFRGHSVLSRSARGVRRTSWSVRRWPDSGENHETHDGAFDDHIPDRHPHAARRLGHPDDEAYLSSALMASVRRDGGRVVVAAATRGEHGTGDPETWPPYRLAQSAKRAAREPRRHRRHRARVARSQRRLAPGCRTRRGSPRSPCCLTGPARHRGDFGPDGMTGHPDHQTCRPGSPRPGASRGCREAPLVRHDDAGVPGGVGRAPRDARHLVRGLRAPGDAGHRSSRRSSGATTVCSTSSTGCSRRTRRRRRRCWRRCSARKSSGRGGPTSTSSPLDQGSYTGNRVGVMSAAGSRRYHGHPPDRVDPHQCDDSALPAALGMPPLDQQARLALDEAVARRLRTVSVAAARVGPCRRRGRPGCRAPLIRSRRAWNHGHTEFELVLETVGVSSGGERATAGCGRPLVRLDAA